ncbi:hypothetical protein [Streptomyces sp. NBC_01264]|uniref:hypothetical protein n=1 Tax=Streptomyces sp. NBC_01264 TaxID=2903804 RepID=UPI0022548313|nr:hypothetical protein [Streptomyces sp. NBC_01264]MCX4779045.1 hypothetical protein [Streptomyces sp. NBC_01264]
MSTSPRTPLLRRLRTTSRVMASAFFASSLALAPHDLLQGEPGTGSGEGRCPCPYGCSARA